MPPTLPRYRHEASPQAADRWIAIATPTLVVLTPFVVFLKYHAFDLWHPAAVLCLGILGLAGAAIGVAGTKHQLLGSLLLAALLTAFLDLQFVFDTPWRGVGKTKMLVTAFVLLAALIYAFRALTERLIASVMAVMLLSTLVLPQDQIVWRHEQPPSSRADLPFVLHVVLDEHLGIDGIPGELTNHLEQDLLDWYGSRGFAVFTSAYSRWPGTLRSLGDALNLRFDAHGEALTVQATPPYTNRLLRSTYFERLKTKGHVLKIMQTAFLDLCTAAAPRWCETLSTRVGVIEGLPMPMSDKVFLLAVNFAAQSQVVREAGEVLVSLRRRGVQVPVWSRSRTRVVPFIGQTALERLSREVADAQRGDVMFAHVLLPHHSYVYESDCRIRRVKDWLEPQALELPDARHTPTSRALTYERFADQVRCTLRALDRVLEAIPADLQRDAVVIVHGDHGPKISFHSPQDDALPQLVRSDYMDTYSVLFAVKAPRLPPNREGRQMPIGCILEALLDGDFSSAAALDRCTGSPSIPLWNVNQYVDYPLPPFRPIARE